MESLKEITQRQQAEFPSYFNNPSHDQWLRIVLELCEEICVLKDRDETRQILVEKGKPASDQNIGEFVPSDELTAIRIARHQAFFEELFQKMEKQSD